MEHRGKNYATAIDYDTQYHRRVSQIAAESEP
jgi:hypothetical protein